MSTVLQPLLMFDSLQGVSEASERPGFFKRIMEVNAAGVAKAYAATEALFAQLQVLQSTVL